MAEPELAKLGHVALTTPDLDTSLWFLRDIIGLEQVEEHDGTTFLRAWGDIEHHTLSVSRGDDAQIEHIAWRARRPEDLDAFAGRLQSNGAAIRWIEPEEERGQGRALRFWTPAGHAFEIYHDIARPSSAGPQRPLIGRNPELAKVHARGISPRRIDHVAVHTPSPSESLEWLRKVLGFRVRESVVRDDGTIAAVWLNVTALSHDIAIVTERAGRSGRFHHLAYHVDNSHDILRAADSAIANGITIDSGPGRHGVSTGVFLYLRDPGSGIRIELFSEGYLCFDQDWQPIEWRESEPQAWRWWGDEWTAAGSQAETLACAPQTVDSTSEERRVGQVE